MPETDAQFVTRSFQDITQAAPSISQQTAGLAYVSNFGRQAWADNLANDPTTRTQVYPVIRFYQGAYARKPDKAGLDFWVDVFVAAGATKADLVSDLAPYFLTSTEYVTMYGSLNNTQFITALFQNLYDRAPDTGGLNFWVGKLDNNELTRAQVFVEFCEAQEFRDIIDPLIQIWLAECGMGTADYSGSLI